MVQINIGILDFSSVLILFIKCSTILFIIYVYYTRLRIILIII